MRRTVITNLQRGIIKKVKLITNNDYRKYFFIALIPLIIGNLLLVQFVSGVTLKLAIQTTKQIYDLGEEIIVYGNLTLDDAPFDRGLVAVQIKDPLNNTLLIRTLATGENASDLVGIFYSLFACDLSGNPKFTFNQGEMLRINATIMNNDVTPRYLVLTASLQFSNNLPFQTFLLYNDTMNPGQRWSCNYPLAYIPTDAPIGTTRIFGSVLTDLPEKNGFALCLGKTSTFSIKAAGSSAKNMEIEGPSEPGGFNLSLITSSKGGILGNYTIYASCYYPPLLSTTQITFEVKLLKDVNQDGTINMIDMYIVALHYGETPESPNWDPRTDIDKNGVINMIDLYLVALDYGKWGRYPP